MSSLLRVELLAVTDEFLVGQIYTVAAAFYDPADYLGAPAVPPQNAERLTAIRLSDNEFESTSLQRRVTRKIASAAMQQDGLRRLGAGSALGNDRVAQNANPVDLNLSPGFIQRGGFCTKPTPSGLPVEITSPALSGMRHSHENHREEWFFNPVERSVSFLRCRRRR